MGGRVSGRRRRPTRSATPQATQQATPRDPFVRVNAFVGFALPTAATNVLLSVQRRLAPRVQETGTQLRWVDPVHLHANLRHLGPVFPEHLEHLADALRAFAAETPSFPVRIGELLVAPSEGPPQALWAELEGDGLSLATVREGIQATFEELGLSLPEGRLEAALRAFLEGLEDWKEGRGRST